MPRPRKARSSEMLSENPRPKIAGSASPPRPSTLPTKVRRIEEALGVNDGSTVEPDAAVRYDTKTPHR